MTLKNLFTPPTPRSKDEVFEDLVAGGEFRVERIVSTGQATPDGQWYDQDLGEWVALLSGSATLRFEDEPDARELTPGDWVNIAPHRRHRVERTDPRQPTVWLAIHYAPKQRPHEPA